MASYIFESTRRLQNRRGEYLARIAKLDGGQDTDERGKRYTDPESQKRWFESQLDEIAAELRSREASE